MIESAILLSAGRGERLRPLTDTIPKPLIPVAGKPLIVYHIEKLARLGIKQIIINISYLAKEIQSALGNGEKFGVSIQYSSEPELLETGGGVLKAMSFLNNSHLPFFVISSDIYTDYAFEKQIQAAFVQNFLTQNLSAHLILTPNPSYHPTGDFQIDHENKILPKDTDSTQPNYTYASMGIYHQSLFEKHPPEPRFRLSPLLEKAVQKKQITGEIYFGQWYNVGTQSEYQMLRDIIEQ